MTLMANFLRLLLIIASLSAVALGQSAGTKDLTLDSPQPPSDHLPRPSTEACPQVNTGISDGSSGRTAKTVSSDLELSIPKVTPPVLHMGEVFTAIVRVKNVSTNEISLPWEANGESVARVGNGADQEEYEAVDIALRLKSGTNQKAPVWLNTSGALFAHPEVQSTYVVLKPSEWVDVKLRGKVECGHEGLPCGKIVPDKRATLSAWWYQRQLIHSIHGCDENYGNSVIRELESKPQQVAVSRLTSRPAH